MQLNCLSFYQNIASVVILSIYLTLVSGQTLAQQSLEKNRPIFTNTFSSANNFSPNLNIKIGVYRLYCWDQEKSNWKDCRNLKKGVTQVFSICISDTDMPYHFLTATLNTEKIQLKKIDGYPSCFKGQVIVPNVISELQSIKATDRFSQYSEDKNKLIELPFSLPFFIDQVNVDETQPDINVEVKNNNIEYGDFNLVTSVDITLTASKPIFGKAFIVNNGKKQSIKPTTKNSDPKILKFNVGFDKIISKKYFYINQYIAIEAMDAVGHERHYKIQ